MKAIRYGNGVVEFRIPSSWKEEYSAIDGGTFYDNRPDAGTFRLKLITALSPSKVAPASAVSALKGLTRARTRIETLLNGNALAKFEDSTTDRGQKIKIFYWAVSNLVPPRHVRIATFSYTILEHQEIDPRIILELQMLDQEIRAAIFSRVIGTVSRASLH